MKLHILLPRWSVSALGSAVLLLTLLTIPKSDAVITKGEVPRKLKQCYNNYSNVNLRNVVGELVVWYCDTTVLSTIRPKKLKNNPTSDAYVTGLFNKVRAHSSRHRHRRQATGKCRRKEYRMMTDSERNAYHNAINTLKRDTTVMPNKFDALASIHTGAVDSAHGGPNFLGWHRVYILMYEIALQEVDRTVCIPYWDSSLDNELSEPWDSYVFSADFLGDNNVTIGPFTGWRTPDDGPLMRNLGGDGELFQIAGIEDILSRDRTRDIIPPNAEPQFDLEFQHGGVHVFVGGHMLQLQTASFDPIFWLHHAFVDYLWELFRTKQRALRINPEMDYPEEFGSELHRFNMSMGFGLGLTAEQGYNDTLAETYEYEPSPDCSRRRRNCGSKYLRCSVSRGRCVPVDPNVVDPDPPTPAPGTTPKPHPPTPTPWPTPRPHCKKHRKIIFPIQNNYCLDGVCDTTGWVYVPVKVVSMRPPGMHNYGSYPVKNGNVVTTNDIYKDSSYAGTNRFINSIKGTPKGYQRCNDQEGFSQIFVQSTGINYNGFYKESAIIDQRLATSLAVAYVAVKNPRRGKVTALFRAFDSCGRICHTACKIPGTGRYEACAGALDIENVRGQPRQYSNTYGQATLNTWGYAQNQDCPKFLVDDIPLTFYCDYRDHITWADRKATPMKPLPRPTVASIPPPRINECKVDDACTIEVPCSVGRSQCSTYGETHKCRASCNMYAVCNYGRYWTRTCPFNMSFNDEWHVCSNRQMCWSKPKRKINFPIRRPDRTWNNRWPQNQYIRNLRNRIIG